MGYEERHCGDLNIFAAGEGKSICRVSGFSDWDCHREVREAECGSIKIIETVPPAPRRARDLRGNECVSCETFGNHSFPLFKCMEVV